MAGQNMVTLTDTNFDQEVIKSAVPVLVDFWAEWCGPCKMLGPVLDELAGEYTGKAKIGKLNIDEHQALANQFRITSFPPGLFLKNGHPPKKFAGRRSRG